MKQDQDVTEEVKGDRLLVTVEEAARRLSIGRSHVYEQMQRGRLRSIHIGRSRRILSRDLDGLIDNLLGVSADAAPASAQPGPTSPVKRVPLRAGRR